MIQGTSRPPDVGLLLLFTCVVLNVKAAAVGGSAFRTRVQATNTASVSEVFGLITANDAAVFIHEAHRKHRSTNILTDTLLGSIQCFTASAEVPLGRTTGSRRSISKVTKQDGKHREPAMMKEVKKR